MVGLAYIVLAKGGDNMVSFEYNSREYRNFDLDNQDNIDMLIENGVPQSVIDELKNKPKPPTMQERLEAVELAMLDLILGGAE